MYKSMSYYYLSVYALVRKSIDSDIGWLMIFPVYQDLVCGAASFWGWSVAQCSMALPVISSSFVIVGRIGLWGLRGWLGSNWVSLRDRILPRHFEFGFRASVHLVQGARKGLFIIIFCLSFKGQTGFIICGHPLKFSNNLFPWRWGWEKVRVR